MNCSIRRNAMLSLRLVLAALISSLALVCFAQPAAPEVNIEIVTIGEAEHVRLSWEAVEDTESYNIYSSNEADPEDWGEPLATVGEEVTEYTTEESIEELGESYFFYVAAFAEPVVPEWLVLVDGDLFNGDVTIDPFYISKYQVTQEEWIEVMGEWDFEFPDNPTHAAETINWFDAVEYCNRLSIQEGLTPCYEYIADEIRYGTNPDEWPAGWNEEDENHTNVSCDWEADGYRLPTEAEWNHAANAGIHPEPFRYSGSDNIDEVAWYGGNSDIGDGLGRRTHPVGTKEPNGLGIYDMSGNVFEWCWDIWGGTFPSGDDNPRGDGTHDSRRVRRGGGWNSLETTCTVSSRATGPRATWRGDTIGFRAARNIP